MPSKKDQLLHGLKMVDKKLDKLIAGKRTTATWSEIRDEFRKRESIRGQLQDMGVDVDEFDVRGRLS